MARLSFTVVGIHCSSCGMLIDNTVEDVPGVSSSTTDVRRRTTTVEFADTNVAPAAVIAAIGTAGYSATLASD